PELSSTSSNGVSQLRNRRACSAQNANRSASACSYSSGVALELAANSGLGGNERVSVSRFSRVVSWSVTVPPSSFGGAGTLSAYASRRSDRSPSGRAARWLRPAAPWLRPAVGRREVVPRVPRCADLRSALQRGPAAFLAPALAPGTVRDDTHEDEGDPVQQQPAGVTVGDQVVVDVHAELPEPVEDHRLGLEEVGDDLRYDQERGTDERGDRADDDRAHRGPARCHQHDDQGDQPAAELDQAHH